MAVIYLVRHGQASFGAADYDALSELGFAQAQALGINLRSRLPKLDQAWRGSLRRHAQTAERCLESSGHALSISVDPGFNEFNHEEIMDRHRPEWADRSRMRAELAAQPNPMRAFQHEFQRSLERWYSGEHEDYAESFNAFQARVLGAVERLQEQLDRDAVALVFTSGGVISTIAQHQLQLPRAQAIALNALIVNCSLSKLLIGSSGRTLISLNEHGHFEGAAAHLLSYR